MHIGVFPVALRILLVMATGLTLPVTDLVAVTLPLVTVTFSVTVPEAPAFNLMYRVIFMLDTLVELPIFELV